MLKLLLVDKQNIVTICSIKNNKAKKNKREPAHPKLVAEAVVALHFDLACASAENQLTDFLDLRKENISYYFCSERFDTRLSERIIYFPVSR